MSKELAYLNLFRKIYITLSDIIDPNAIPNSKGSVLTPEKDSY